MNIYTPEMQALQNALQALTPGQFYAMDADKITGEQAKTVALSLQWRMEGWGFTTFVDPDTRKRVIVRNK